VELENGGVIPLSQHEKDMPSWGLEVFAAKTDLLVKLKVRSATAQLAPAVGQGFRLLLIGWPQGPPKAHASGNGCRHKERSHQRIGKNAHCSPCAVPTNTLAGSEHLPSMVLRSMSCTGGCCLPHAEHTPSVRPSLNGAGTLF